MTVTLDPLLARSALQRVARGQIVFHDGLLCHRGDALPPAVLSMLQDLHRHGYIAPRSCLRRTVAALSLSGTQLLDWWNTHPGTTWTPVVGQSSCELVTEVVGRDQQF
jgi:hypothetical protein